MTTGTDATRFQRLVRPTIFAMAVCAGASAILPARTPAAGTAPEMLATSNGGLEVVGGTIRNVGTGWFVAADATHSPVNLTVDPGGQRITIRYPSSSGIVALVATPDETFARAGYLVGASVSTGHAVISGLSTFGTRIIIANADGRCGEPLAAVGVATTAWLSSPAWRPGSAGLERPRVCAVSN